MKFNFFLFLLILASCQIGPEYHPPCVEVPQEWKNKPEEIKQVPHVCFWWELFQDEVLNELEKQAIFNNPNLFIALSRVEEAWAKAGIERANLFPQLTLDPQYKNTGMLFKIYLPPGDNTFADLFNLKNDFRIHQMLFSLPLNMNYELDLWGKYRSLYQSAKANAQSLEEGYHSALLTLTSNVASAYYNLRTLDASLALLNDIVETRRQDYTLNQNRYKNGLVNSIVVSNSFDALANAESTFFDTQKQRQTYENVLATLLGIPASEFNFEPIPIRDFPPTVPAGIPSDVLRRRPDILEAERRMNAEHLQINAAYASLFPSFTLTGTLGFVSPDFDHFMEWMSRYWSYGVNANQTVFDAGRKFSSIDASWALFWQASGEYRERVLKALQEVETALSHLKTEKEQSAVILQLKNSAEGTYKLALRRYEKGLVSSTESIDYKRNFQNAEYLYLNLIGQQYQTTIELIKALGGGWDISLTDSASKEESCE